MFDDSYDVVIVGARIAGSVLAALLGDAGHKVLLIDRDRFPSSTLSTHFFRGAFALSVFKQLGVLDEILALRPPPLRHEYTYINGEAEADVQPPHDPGDVGYSLSVRREPLDSILLNRARRSGSVQFEQQCGFVDVIRDNGQVTGVTLRQHGETQQVRASMVVGADGRLSAVARAVDAPYEDQTPGFRAIYYHYFRDFAPAKGQAHDGAEFSYLEDGITYVFPSDQDLTCIAISVNMEDFKRIKSDAQQGYRDYVSQHKGLADRIAAAVPVERLWGLGPQPNYVRTPYGPGWALVGDAGLHQDPWTGRGIDLACTHATFLAEALLMALADPAQEAPAMAQYHQQRNDPALKLYHNTINFGRDLRQLFAD